MNGNDDDNSQEVEEGEGMTDRDCVFALGACSSYGQDIQNRRERILKIGVCKIWKIKIFSNGN
jgi:hypothetical protein